MIKEITSTSNSLIKELSSLSTSDKKEKNLVLIEGEDLVELAFEKGCLDYLFVLEENKKYASIDQYLTKDYILKKLSKNKSVPSLIGVGHLPLSSTIKGNKLVYLDGVQDPGNVGTILRTALSFGYDGVILSADCASLYNEKTIQASKGAIFKISTYQNLSLKELKANGYQIISTTLRNALDYRKVQLKEKFVLVLGNEGQGIKEETYDISDELVKIPMDGIDSLNVGVAAGILLNHYRF
jgi:TrmH family RNA methyltransferase